MAAWKNEVLVGKKWRRRQIQTKCGLSAVLENQFSDQNPPEVWTYTLTTAPIKCSRLKSGLGALVLELKWCFAIRLGLQLERLSKSWLNTCEAWVGPAWELCKATGHLCTAFPARRWAKLCGTCSTASARCHLHHSCQGWGGAERLFQKQNRWWYRKAIHWVPGAALAPSSRSGFQRMEGRSRKCSASSYSVLGPPQRYSPRWSIDFIGWKGRG